MPVEKIPYPPDPSGIVRELKSRGDKLGTIAAQGIELLHKSTCNMMDVASESAQIIEDLCRLLATVKPALDEYNVMGKMLLEKYPDESIVVDFLEQNHQLEANISTEARRLTEIAFENMRKGR